MSLPQSLVQQFEQLSKQPDAEFQTIEAALLVSKILQPSANIKKYHDKIRDLCTQLQETYQHQKQIHPSLIAKITALQHVMGQDIGFHGDEDAFDDLDHMNIFQVLEHKCATALTLSLIYTHCAQQCGWKASILNFPGYCLMRLDEGAERKIIDPFHNCTELDAFNLRQLLKVIGGAEAELTPDFYESISNKTVAMRHINAIKMHFLRCEQMEKAVEILEALVSLESESPIFWREKGLLQARLQNYEDAIACLKTALRFTTDVDAIRHTEHILIDIEKNLSDREI